ncbi:MAG TPA: chemotaxis protein CheA, partial [Geobacteraceae bacterium]
PAAAPLPESSLRLEQFLGILTSYETDRLRANLKQGRCLYASERLYNLERLKEDMAEGTHVIGRCGELISAVPSTAEAPPGACGFTLLFVSSRPACELGKELGVIPREVDTSSFLAAAVSPPDTPARTFRVRFSPPPAILLTGFDPVELLADLRRLGTCKVMARTDRVPTLPDFDPSVCYFHWDAVLTTTRDVNAIKDVFILVEEGGELVIEELDDGGITGAPQYKRLGEILVERGDLEAAELDRVLASQKRLGEILVESGLVEADKVHAALVEQQHVRDVRQQRQSQESASSIRVPAERLDKLVNLVGELVTVQARLSQTASIKGDAELDAIAEEVERLTAELRDNALNIRMLPVGTTFAKFKRLMHDLAAELGKEVEMITAGGETELDKTVLEKLNDPLVHIIRNSIDHGIERPEARVAAGKPRHGTVHLSAVHSGDCVIIAVRDDGAGLDREAIRAKAVEKGLVSPHAELSEQEIYAQIFAPGFSTAKTVTSVSGRGVGMDVVKRALDALRGTIEVASRRGDGTTITVKIPLTLAIVESLLVRIGADRFVLPLALVEECVELSRQDAMAGHGRNLANVRGKLVPYIPLREVFGIAGERPEFEQIVITNLAGERIGFVVDHVVGEHQTVIKSLGRMYRDVAGISGATVLGDGSVALILDASHLARQA